MEEGWSDKYKKSINVIIQKDLVKSTWQDEKEGDNNEFKIINTTNNKRGFSRKRKELKLET